MLKRCPFCGCTVINTSVNLCGVKIWCDDCGAMIAKGGGKMLSSLADAKNKYLCTAEKAWNERVNLCEMDNAYNGLSIEKLCRKEN